MCDSATCALLDKVTAVVLTDKRQVIGNLSGIDASGNIVMSRVVMLKKFESDIDGEVRTITRTSASLIIPFAHISAIYQCDGAQYEINVPNTN